MDLNFTDLDLLSMFEQGIERGKDKTAIIYQRANGVRENISFNEIDEEAKKLLKKMLKM